MRRLSISKFFCVWLDPKGKIPVHIEPLHNSADLKEFPPPSLMGIGWDMLSFRSLKGSIRSRYQNKFGPNLGDDTWQETMEFFLARLMMRNAYWRCCSVSTTFSEWFWRTAPGFSCHYTSIYNYLNQALFLNRLLGEKQRPDPPKAKCVWELGMWVITKK